MKNKKVQEILSQYPDDADVGFEYLNIVYATYSEKDNYVDLGGNGSWINNKRTE